MPIPAVTCFSGRDGARLACREVGEGRALVLLHGPVLAGTETFEPGSPQERAAQWLRTGGEDPAMLPRVLDSPVATPEELPGRIQVPTLVVMGSDDERADSVDEMVAAMVDFLAGPR